MKTIKLDDINESFIVFGGPYGNLQAIEALKEVADTHEIAPHNIFCTGDIVAYYAQPAECVDFIRQWGINVVKGNCEQAIADNVDECNCGFAKGSHCDMYSKSWFDYVKTQISEEQANWMAQLPEHITFLCNGLKVMMYHASYDSNNRFLFASHSESFFLQEFKKTQMEMIIAGHSGLPFTREIVNDRCAYIWHNAGSVGMPANDGRTHTWYSIISPKKRLGRLEIMHKKLHYDYELAAELMRKAGYCPDYAKTLETGLWPSMDILPETERKKCGRRIKLKV